MSGPYFGKKTLCVITGASRGIGRSAAVKLAHNLGAGSTLLVTARGKQPLDQLKAQLAKECPAVKVVVCTSDLATANETEYKKMLTEGLANQKAAEFQVAILVHNAVAVNSTDAEMDRQMRVDAAMSAEFVGQGNALDRNFHSNVTAMICLNTVFLRMMAEVKDRLVVNITSLAGVEPLPGSAIYCTTKAAREMFIRCLVVEDKTVRAVSYAPGAVDTKLLQDTAKEREDFGRLLQAARAGKAPFTLLTPDETVSRLFDILAADTYENGGHMDYEDDWQNAYTGLLALLKGKPGVV